MMTELNQGLGQDNTTTSQIGNEGTQAAAAEVTANPAQENAEVTTNNVAEGQTAAPEGTQEGSQEGVSSNEQDQALGQEVETEEQKFAKEYTGKPDAYDYTEVMPEGMELNKDLTEKFNDIAGKYNMSQKGASEAMSLAVDLAKHTKDSMMNSLIQQCETQKSKFFEALKADPEIGGNKLDETIKTGNLAYKSYIQNIDAEAHQIIVDSGLCNNRAFVKMLYDFGKQMQDGTINNGDALPSGGEQSREEIMYPELANN